MDFHNQVVVVTGGANGIGKAISLGYARNGAKVVIADVDDHLGIETVADIKKDGFESNFIKTDVRNPIDIDQLFLKVSEMYGRINILINNAGVSRWKSPLELSVNEWDDVINTNLRSTFLCSKEAAKMMKENQYGGSIVNIASTRALMSEPNSEAYAASKGGIVALTHALAISLGNCNIRVNAISPGWIETKNYEGLTEVDHSQHPVNRVGKPEDIVRGCFYLSDPKNDFITGQNIVIDGGMTVKMLYEE